MKESKRVREYRKSLQGDDPAAKANAEGEAAKFGLEIQDAESKRPGAGKSLAPGDHSTPGIVEADIADDPRQNRPATHQPAPGEGPRTKQKLARRKEE
ncbi:hypothetical protein [Dongia sp.]|uniref:hypothetical protein n=1 Tax=Dongia sp. TaxID=1977262 RepID=UPI0035B2458E